MRPTWRGIIDGPHDSENPPGSTLANGVAGEIRLITLFSDCCDPAADRNLCADESRRRKFLQASHSGPSRPLLRSGSHASLFRDYRRTPPSSMSLLLKITSGNSPSTLPTAALRNSAASASDCRTSTPIISPVAFREAAIAIEGMSMKAETASGAKDFALDAARMLANTRCHNVVVLDVRNLSPVTDFMVLATGTSPRQMKTACEDVEELGEPRGFAHFHEPGTTDSGPASTWSTSSFTSSAPRRGPITI